MNYIIRCDKCQVNFLTNRKKVLDTEQLFVYIIDSTNIRYVRSLYHGKKTRRIKRKAS